MGEKQRSFTIAPFSRPFGLELAILCEYIDLYSFCDIILKTKKCSDYIENLRYNRAFKKALAAIFFGIVCYDISNV